jgi:hypothetical protein
VSRDERTVTDPSCVRRLLGHLMHLIGEVELTTQAVYDAVRGATWDKKLVVELYNLTNALDDLHGRVDEVLASLQDNLEADA